MLLTSWAIVADVWYLPPVTQQEGESSIAYANRVKSEIARQGGLVDLEWYVFSIAFSAGFDTEVQHHWSLYYKCAILSPCRPLCERPDSATPR